MSEGDNVVCLRPVNAPDAFVETAAQGMFADGAPDLPVFAPQGTVKPFNKRFLWSVLARAVSFSAGNAGASKMSLRSRLDALEKVVGQRSHSGSRTPADLRRIGN